MNGRERVTAMIEGRPVDRLPHMPIVMLFAARHAGTTFRDYCADHRSLVETQIRVAEDFDADQVSCNSDPSREVSDLGGCVRWFDDQPPAIVEEEALLKDKTALARLKFPDPLGGGRMHERVKAAALFKQRVRGEKIIEGWVEGPCAMGSDLRGINALMLDYGDDPVFVRDLFEFCVEMELRFARAQAQAGVELMGVGDAAASLVGPRIYNEFIWPYEQKLVDGLHALGLKVRLHICGNTRKILDGMGRLGCEIVDLDWLAPLNEARAAMPGQVLLGNVDPVRVLRDGDPESVAAAIGQCHAQAGERYIVSAGCEVCRETRPENVQALAEYARHHAPDQAPALAGS